MTLPSHHLNSWQTVSDRLVAVWYDYCTTAHETVLLSVPSSLHLLVVWLGSYAIVWLWPATNITLVVLIIVTDLIIVNCRAHLAVTGMFMTELFATSRYHHKPCWLCSGLKSRPNSKCNLLTLLSLSLDRGMRGLFSVIFLWCNVCVLLLWCLAGWLTEHGDNRQHSWWQLPVRHTTNQQPTEEIKPTEAKLICWSLPASV